MSSPASVVKPPTYDSAARRSATQDTLELWARRDLVMMVARRQLRLRYQRSALGVWWTLVQPLLEMAVLWAVFSQLFRFSTPDAPYVVYLLSGLALAALMRNTILAVTSSIDVNSTLMTRIRVPTGLFPAAALVDVFVSFLVGLVPLLVIMLIAGPGVSIGIPLAAVPALLTAMFALGVGLALAPLAASFPDTVILVGVILSLVSYLAPVFYPVDIVPEAYVALVDANPLSHFLALFRAALYEDGLGNAIDYIVAGASAITSLAVGIAVYRRFVRTALMRL